MKLCVALAAGALLVAGCSGGEAVPEDQVPSPAPAPDGWQTAELGPVVVAAPPGWERSDTEAPTPTVESTTWVLPADDADDDVVAAVEVRTIEDRDNEAEQAMTSLSMTSRLFGGEGAVSPEKIVWPGAEVGYVDDFGTTRVGDDGERTPYHTWIMVLDLPDERQVQVILQQPADLDPAVPAQLLASVELES